MRSTNLLPHVPNCRLNVRPFQPSGHCQLLRSKWAPRYGRGQQRGLVSNYGPLRCGASKQSEAPARAAGRETYKPATFKEMVEDATTSILKAIDRGDKLLEVSFPPLPSSASDYKSSSDRYVDANIQMAIAAGRQMVAAGKKVLVLVPDKGEYDRAVGIFKASLEASPGVTLGYLNESNTFKILKSFMGGKAPTDAKMVEAGRLADVFVVVNASTVELLDMEAYTKEVVGDRPLVAWNLELDTLRADLGLPSFPGKDFQYRFLAAFRPVFYLRPRDYSKTVPVSPFIINYSGALFREFPGPWQVMIKQDDGTYACISEDDKRYNLGEVKEELLNAIGLNEEEGSTMQFLRRGYKNSTWWEEDYDKELTHKWRD